MAMKRDSQAILLLCGVFGRRGGGVSPLTSAQYRKLVAWLMERGEGPSVLLSPEGQSLLESHPPEGLDAERIRALLRRGGAMALAVEGWRNHGLWVMTRADGEYPSALKKRLGQAAPPVLYGAGETALLGSGGLAVVGSRNVDDTGLDFCRRLGGRCAVEGMAVVSGGARGVDEAAMLAALEAGGRSVGVLANSLERAACSKKFRGHILDGRLVLASPYHPQAPFLAGHAMERNKFIYCLANWGLAVDSSLRKGGTWTGAVENLGRKWVPMFVRRATSTSPGNEALVREGAAWFPDRLPPEDTSLKAWLDQESQAPSATSLLDLMRESAASPGQADETKKNDADEARPQLPLTENDLPGAGRGDAASDIYGFVLSVLLARLDDVERKPDELAEELGVRKVQLDDWLEKAVQQGRVKRLKRPVRYVRA